MTQKTHANVRYRSQKQQDREIKVFQKQKIRHPKKWSSQQPYKSQCFFLTLLSVTVIESLTKGLIRSKDDDADEISNEIMKYTPLHLHGKRYESG